MLVLTRKSGEGIRVGDDIRVIVTEIREGQVRLGIEAPKSIGIYRDEVYALIEEENRCSVSTTSQDISNTLKMIER